MVLSGKRKRAEEDSDEIDIRDSSWGIGNVSRSKRRSIGDDRALSDFKPDEESHSESDSSIISTEDETSSSGSSDTEEADEDDEDGTNDAASSSEEEPITLTSLKGPRIKGNQPSDLRSKLSRFLPQLKEANDVLDRQTETGRIDHVPDDQDHYIEMNLGLGVLKEIKTADDGVRTTLSDEGSSSDESSDTEEEDMVQKGLRKEKTSAGIVEVDTG